MSIFSKWFSHKEPKTSQVKYTWKPCNIEVVVLPCEPTVFGLSSDSDVEGFIELQNNTENRLSDLFDDGYEVMACNYNAEARAYDIIMRRKGRRVPVIENENKSTNV